MGENSGISWTDHTFNPWMGCTKVSPACANCYAERDWDKRYGKVKWGDGGTRVKTSAENWKKPLLWNQAIEDGKCSGCFGKGFTKKGKGDKAEDVPCNLCDATGKPTRRPRVFCASLADVFEDWRGVILASNSLSLWKCNCGHWFDGASPDVQKFAPSCPKCGDMQGSAVFMNDVRSKLFKLIDATPHLDWLLLTKRPENISRMWPFLRKPPEQHGTDPWKRNNVWLGPSVENQHYADTRIPELLKFRHFSPVLFLSCEPMVGEVDIDGPFNVCGPANGQWDNPSDPPGWLEGGIDWVIAGGESGPNARPADPEWFRSLRDQCATAGVPFHFKQWGEFDEHQVRVGKKAAGRLLDGVLHDAFPTVQEVAHR